MRSLPCHLHHMELFLPRLRFLKQRFFTSQGASLSLCGREMMVYIRAPPSTSKRFEALRGTSRCASKYLKTEHLLNPVFVAWDILYQPLLFCCTKCVSLIAITHAQQILRCTSKYLEALQGASTYFEEQKYGRSLHVRREGAIVHTKFIFTSLFFISSLSCLELILLVLRGIILL